MTLRTWGRVGCRWRQAERKRWGQDFKFSSGVGREKGLTMAPGLGCLLLCSGCGASSAGNDTPDLTREMSNHSSGCIDSLPSFLIWKVRIDWTDLGSWELKRIHLRECQCLWERRPSFCRGPDLRVPRAFPWNQPPPIPLSPRSFVSPAGGPCHGLSLARRKSRAVGTLERTWHVWPTRSSLAETLGGALVKEALRSRKNSGTSRQATPGRNGSSPFCGVKPGVTEGGSRCSCQRQGGDSCVMG